MVVSLGKTIKEIRKLKKIKQKDFASLIGVSERTLLNYESGNTIPSISKLNEISKALDVSLNIFLDTFEGQRILDNNININNINNINTSYESVGSYCANVDLIPDKYNNTSFEKSLESAFIDYINSLITLSSNSNLKSVHFTSEDYRNLIKYCNSSVLNILELYYESNPIVFNLETLNPSKGDDNNE